MDAITRCLYLMRHGKTEQPKAAKNDFARVLLDEGRVQNRQVADELKQYVIKPDLMIASPAARAKETCEIIAHGLGYDETAIEHEKNVYNASLNTLLDIVQHIDEKHRHVFLVGHNPGITYLANALVNTSINDFATSTLCALRFELSSWVEMREGGGKVLFELRP